MQARPFDPDSYMIIIMDCHGEDMPLKTFYGKEQGCFKISAAGESGCLAYQDQHVSHAIYSTCAQYNSRDVSGGAAALALGDMLRNSRLANGELTTVAMSRTSQCNPDTIFKTSIPTYDKVFSFSQEKQWERDNFGIFLVGGYDRARGYQGVPNNPPENIKDAVFAGSRIEKMRMYPRQPADEIFLSTLTGYFKREYNVATLIVVDWSCRATEDEFGTELGRTYSGKALTHAPSVTGPGPARVSASAYRCPHPCPVCDNPAQRRGGNYKKSKNRRKKNKNKNKNKRSKRARIA